MIIDKIENVKSYSEIPVHAIEFISKLNSDIELGRYQLSETDYANVEAYSTKQLDDARFEAHRDYIDIQILVAGNENIYYTSKESLSVEQPYNAQRDIEFFAENVAGYNYLTLDGTNFAMIFPHEAHAPQVVCANDVQQVKKVVVKVHC